MEHSKPRQDRALREVMVKITYLGLVEEGEEVLPADATGDPVREDHTIGLDVHRCVHRVWSIDGQVVGTLALVPVRKLIAFPHNGGV